MKLFNEEQTLRLLGERLDLLVNNENAYETHIDRNIKSENLQYNLSLILSHIILNLKFIDRSKDTFLKTLAEYNTANHTFLKFEDFNNIHWIREVSGEIILPELVGYFIRKIERDEKDGKHISIPSGHEDIAGCLRLYYQKCFDNAKLTIPAVTFNKILSTYSPTSLTKEFFLEKEILEYNSNTDEYIWVDHQYSRYLKNEIASTLWLLLGGAGATQKEFRRFIKLLQGTNIWADRLDDYLSFENTTKIHDFAISSLKDEVDFKQSSTEFVKIWLDAARYLHINIHDEIPNVQFDYSNSFDFIQSVEQHKFRFHDTFDYQRTRSFCHLFFRLIINHEKNNKQSAFARVLQMMTDVSRPFLLWILYKDIEQHYPSVIPYFITNSDLTPLAYRLINTLKIKTAFFTGGADRQEDSQEKAEIKNNIWMEVFHLTLNQLASISTITQNEGTVLGRILLDLADDVFSYKYSSTDEFIAHKSLRKRYDEVLSVLKNKRLLPNGVLNSLPIVPRLIFHIIPEVSKFLIQQEERDIPRPIEHIRLTSGFIDLCIEVIRLANLRVTETEISKEQKDENINASKGLVLLLYKLMNEYFTKTEVVVKDYYDKNPEIKKVKRGVNEFGFEIIDWGYLYLHFEKQNLFETLHKAFSTSLKFNDTNKYDDENKEQQEKIRLYLKSLMIAYLSIIKNKYLYEIDGLPADPLIRKVKKLIKEISLSYSINNFAENKTDAFDEGYRLFDRDLYYVSPINLLYQCINTFENEEQAHFIKSFFKGSTDIRRMLTALNLLDSKKSQAIISDFIRSVEPTDFLKSVFTVTEIQNTVVEAINSESHWQLAKPLLNTIQKHYKDKNYNDENANNLLFEVNLILAFKEKNIQAIYGLEIPKTNTYPPRTAKVVNSKKFFIALHKLYNEKNYDEAIIDLKSLSSSNATNVRYAYHLYRAETLKATENADKEALIKTNNEWDSFLELLNKDDQKELADISQHIAVTRLNYYSTINDNIQFDQTVNKMFASFLYDEETIPVIYNNYIRRELYELAYDYITKANKHFLENGISVPVGIQEIIVNSVSASTLRDLKQSFETILTLSPKDVISIVPKKLNNYNNNLGDFILYEFIQASRVFLNKIHSIKQIKHEDRFNDLFVAILKLRFAIWGWDITDQPRLGSSPTGKNAGEMDILLQAGGQDITLIEALILSGGDFPYTEKHILKCFTYSKSLQKYYVIVYYKGTRANFEQTWTTYKENVLKIDFPSNKEVDTAKGFIDLVTDLQDVKHLKLAKTIHNTDIDMYHIMIDLGQ